MVLIKKEETKEWIRKYYPNFDFSKPMSNGDWFVLRKVLTEKRRREHEAKSSANKFAYIVEANAKYKKGDIVVNKKGEKREVRMVSSNGHLILEGKRGAFNPCGWEKVLP